MSPRLTWAVPASLLAINLNNLLEGFTVTILTSLLGTKAFALLVFLQEAATSPEAGDLGETFTITEMIKHMGGVAIGTVVVLLIMSVYSIAIMVERYLTYTAAKKQSREFAPRVAQALKNNRIEEAITISDKHRKSHLAMVVSSGLQEFRAHGEEGSDVSGDTIEASKRALQRAIAIKTAEFKRGLSGLATIGSTAPFVGLFGTVFGIINAFRGMKNAESAGIAAVAGGISEALFATALGLLVAVPAVWLFNYFTGKVDGFIVEMDNSASELVDYFIKNRAKQLNA